MKRPHFPRIRPLRPRTRAALLALAICGLAYALRVWEVGRGELSFDEVATVLVAHRPVLDVIRYVMGAAREHPPLYFILMSGWFQVAGTSEFAVRYPAVLIGLLSVLWSYRLGGKLLGRAGGIWAALFMAVAPMALSLSRFGRMYTLILWMALLTMEAWWDWLRHPTPRRRLVFTLLALAGPLIHYYLALLWAVEAALLLLAPRATRAVRRPWLITAAGCGVGLAGFILLSPGILKMALETGSRFPFWGSLRVEELRVLLLDLYLGWHYPTLLPPALIALGLTLIGWIAAQRRTPPAGLLLGLWALLPVALSHLVPEAMAPRYFAPFLPALLLGLAAAMTAFRPAWLRAGLAVLILGQAVYRWDHVYLTPTYEFSAAVRQLARSACPGDLLVMNGPWPHMLTNYYRLPAGMPVELVPSAAPPGFIPEVDLPRLERFAREHARIWVLYGSIEPADPDFQTSRWFAEHTYQDPQEHNLVLYQVPPSGPQLTVRQDLSLGDLRLQTAALDRTAGVIGEYFYLDLTWNGALPAWGEGFSLALLDAGGRPWGPEESRFGPAFQKIDAPLPTPWTERRAYWIRPGTPPGEYTLALKVGSPKAALSSDTPTLGDGWIPLQRVTVTAPPQPLPACSPASPTLLPQHGAPELAFGDRLKLAGFAPAMLKFMQGYPIKMQLWWQALGDPSGARVQGRLVGPEESAGPILELGPDFYPTTAWQPGDVVQQEVSWPLPNTLPGGTYHLQVRITGADGLPWPVTGTREALTAGERLRGRRISLTGEWADLAVIRIEARPRSYAPPLFHTAHDARFGDVLRLRGYRLSATRLRPGQSAQLVVYWQAQQRPDRLYAVFNHLRDAGNSLVWQQDSWPQGGIYTTQHWLPGEVVAETYTIVIPEGTPPGPLTLKTGVYDPQDGARLPAADAHGQRYPDDIVPLLTLEVLP